MLVALVGLRFFGLTVILAPVSGIGKQPSAPVGMYVVVYCLSGDMCPFFGQSADNLRRRPLLFRDPLFSAPQQQRRLVVRLAITSASFGLSPGVIVAAACSRVTSVLTADG